jgi:hypothetical protein
MVIAENMIMDTSGGRKKRGQQTYYNSSAITSTPTISGVWEFWKSGVAGSPTQKLVAHTSAGKFYRDDMDGTWDEIGTGFESSKIPDATVFGDKIILTTSSTSDAPQYWDQTTFGALAGSPPNFNWSFVHRGRLLVGGIAATPHRIQYSQALDPTTWSGVGTGYIDIDPNDGDEKGVVGAISFGGEAFIFKHNSTHRLVGSGPEDWTKPAPVLPGIGALNHRCIVATENDIYFASRRGLMSLKKAETYGDVEAAYASFPIQDYWRDSLIHSTTANWSMVYHPEFNSIVITCCKSGSTNNFMMFYNILLDSWYYWTGVTAASMCRYYDSSTKKMTILTGGYAGKAAKQDQSGFSDYGTTAYTFRMKTPIIYPGVSGQGGYARDTTREKGFRSVTIHGQSSGEYNVQLTYTVLGQSSYSDEFSFRGAGTALGTFLLGTHKLGTKQTTSKLIEIDGYGEGIQLDIIQSEDAKNVDIYGYDIEYKPGARSQALPTE